MNVKTGLIFLFVLFNLTSCRRYTEKVPAGEGSNRTTLRVALDLDMPGYFLFNGEAFGYQYEILKEYARHSGSELELVSDYTPQSYPELFENGSLDMAVTLHPEYYSFTGTEETVPVYETRYVVLTGRKTAKISDTDLLFSRLADKKVLVPQGFVQTESFDMLLDSAPAAEIYLSSRNVFEQMELLSSGKCDYLICESTEAAVGCTLLKNIRAVYEFPETIPVSLVFDSGSGHSQRFREWLAGFSGSSKAEKLAGFYHGGAVGNAFVTEAPMNRPKGSTSIYDELFRRLCAEERMDWRMVSAIAYHESMYNSFLVSPRGARGLMQVMPVVARQFGVPSDSLMDPEINVRLAIQLLKKIESSLKISPEAGFENRMAIILACYNGGIGHVTDARRLVAKYGGDPDSWEDVSRYLQLKSEEEYYTDEVVTCGRFIGGGTTRAFVSNVMGRYRNYCALASL